MNKAASWTLALLAVLYFALLVSNLATVAGGADSSGYLNEARLLSRGRIREPHVALDQLALGDEAGWLFTPLGYVPGAGRSLVPTYPPGLPLLMALAASIGGWSLAPFLVVPLTAAGALILFWLTARELGLGKWESLLGSVVLAGCPTFLFQALQPMSDVPATFFSLAAILCALRTGAPPSSRRGDGWALLAGAAFAMGVLVRPTTMLLLIPLIIAMRFRPRPLLLAGLGGLPLALLLAALNNAAHGHPLRTGYGTVELELAVFPLAFPHYCYWLAVLLTPLVFPGGLAALALPSVPAWHRWLLGFWFALFFFFYCLYWAWDAWWYTRFLLPAIPALLIGFLLVLRSAVKRIPERPRLRLAIGAAATLLILAAEVRIIRREYVLRLNQAEQVYPRAVRLLSSRIPARSLVLAMQTSGALHYYSSLTPVRWDLMTPDQFELLRAHASIHGYSWYALLFPFEAEVFRRRASGEWTQIGAVEQVTLWRLER